MVNESDVFSSYCTSVRFIGWVFSSLSASQFVTRVYSFSELICSAAVIQAHDVDEYIAVAHVYMYGFISSCQWVDAFSSYCYIVRTCMGWVYVNNHITCVSSSCRKCVCADTSTSQLAEPLWTEPGLKSRISMHTLINKKIKKRRQGMNGWTFSQNPRKWGKSHYHLCSAVIALVFGFLSVNVFSSCHTTAWRLVNE